MQFVTHHYIHSSLHSEFSWIFTDGEGNDNWDFSHVALDIFSVMLNVFIEHGEKL